MLSKGWKVLGGFCCSSMQCFVIAISGGFINGCNCRHACIWKRREMCNNAVAIGSSVFASISPLHWILMHEMAIRPCECDSSLFLSQKRLHEVTMLHIMASRSLTSCTDTERHHQSLRCQKQPPFTFIWLTDETVVLSLHQLERESLAGGWIDECHYYRAVTGDRQYVSSTVHFTSRFFTLITWPLRWQCYWVVCCLSCVGKVLFVCCSNITRMGGYHMSWPSSPFLPQTTSQRCALALGGGLQMRFFFFHFSRLNK